jgi:hypothetical protein
MNRKDKEERIKALRSDPDFRALVECLKEQSTEQVESFVEHAEHSDQFEEEDADNGREE